MAGWRVIVQVETPRRMECVTFADVPLVDPAHVAVVAHSPSASATAETLYDEIVQQLGVVTPATWCGGPRLLSCQGRTEPTCRSVLALVTDATPLAPAALSLVQNWLQTGSAQGTLLPILPAGASPSVVLPAPLDTVQVLFDSGSPQLLAPDVLRCAGVGGTDHRMFVSYRRDDARDLADQLHDAFVRSGFRVYLDRFVGVPGQPFPQQLAEELADKGLVVVVESPGVRRSKWTLEEVALSAQLRLGLIALQMPGGPRFGLIQTRFDATDPSQWNSSSAGGLVLKADVLQDVIAFVRSQYVRQMVYRRVFLESLLKRTWLQNGLSAPMYRSGLYDVASASTPVQQYTLHLASRPPCLNDIRRVTDAAGPARHPVVLGPLRLLPSTDQVDVKWLGDRVQLSFADEGRMLPFALSVRNGMVPL
jgi:TIR domain